MSGFPIISIIIPCYNQSRYLGETLDSILAQTYPHWECIVINDGSTDDTASVARRYSHQDQRIRSIEQENKGLSAARNRGLEEIKGDFVQFLDSDDTIAETKFEKQIDLIKDLDKSAVVYCDYYFGQAEDIRQRAHRNFPKPQFILKEPLWDMAARWETELSIPAHCFLFDCTFFQTDQIRFDKQLITHEDWDCWMRIFAEKPDLFFVPEELAAYRLNPQSMCTNKKKMWFGFRDAINKQQRIFEHDQIISRLLNEKFRQMRARYGYDHITNFANYFINQSWFKNTIPWPIQKRLVNLVDQRRDYRYPSHDFLRAAD
ncbi:glycosyltransferase family 2 protein [Thiocystis violacea]|uniref:glycosyltransferase family 2 protein n=1 Tax=Thiocystis violacea TaxID=13725 RepID=UPI001906060B|nr:glycosyltransferase family 2 protein [Thiocystis violacea]